MRSVVKCNGDAARCVCAGVFIVRLERMLKPRVRYLCAFDSWCTLAREEQGDHVKLERRGELKKRKEEKAIKG